MLLEVKNLSFSYRKKPILENISFEFSENKSVCILGKNGVGKSTLFKCLLGFLSPQRGEIKINGQLFSKDSIQERAKQISYIPQKQQSVFSFTVFEMILMGTTVTLKSYQQPGEKQYKLVEEALNLLNIQHLRDCVFSEISGGEQQLTIIARAVAQQSKIIIMDEPCANLDYGNQIMVFEMIQSLVNKGYLIIQSTHDPNYALQYADEVLVMSKGKPILQGTPEEVLTAKTLEDIYEIPVSIHIVEETKEKICVPKKGGHYVEHL